MTAQSAPPSRNHLLASLPKADYARIRSELEPVTLSLGDAICEPHAEMEHVYFPVDTVISLLCVMDDGESAEIAVVGCEGIVGISQFLGGETTPSRAVAHSPGQAYRLSGRVLKNAFYRGGPMQRLLLRYTQALLTQMAQTALCNRHHTVDQQLCRWLLLSHDRLAGDELLMTQELIAKMLGVRREGVTEAAGRLQRAEVIDYYRGHISILDRAGLEARTCKCYRMVQREYERLLPPKTAQ